MPGPLSINLCKPCLGTAYGLPDELLAHPDSKDITAEWVPGIDGGDKMIESFSTEKVEEPLEESSDR